MRAQAQTGVITHTIRQGETLSALSAKYKTTVGDIMRLNNMNSGSKLAIGQKVKIPASGKPVAASKPAATPAASPIATASTPAATGAVTTHTVKQGETLYRISQTYHVKVDQIKAWNHLTADNVSIGQVLSIGTYTSESAPVQNTTPAEIPVVTTPANNTPANTAPPVATTPLPTSTPVNTTPVNTTPAGSTPQATPPATGTSVANKQEPYVNPSKVTDKGYFESLFGADVAGRSIEKTSGTAMTFKTASGWTDKKYYILVNDIAPGSIVKITNADGNKTIYAKVLWNMGDLKENEGLSYRISNAAADALGISDLKFQISVAYYD